jgi:hypothetical protein
MTALEQRLVELGRELDVPAAPLDLATSVAAEIRSERRVASPRGRRRLAVVCAVVLGAALLATLAIPDARSAVLRFFGIGAERIELVDELPEVQSPYAPLDALLGERVSLAEAREGAGFDLLELDEEPDAVFVGDRGTVWFLYGEIDDVRLLVAQTGGLELGEPALMKKLVAGGTSVRDLVVRGELGYFLSGTPHLLYLVDEVGQVVPESARLVRDVLVWEENGRTIRLEGELTEDAALELAESLRVRSRG